MSVEPKSVGFSSGSAKTAVHLLPGASLLEGQFQEHSWQLIASAIGPEFTCSKGDAGINGEVGAVFDTRLPNSANEALASAIVEFEHVNGASPTYGDHLVTGAGPMEDRGISHILHALGADSRSEPERHAVTVFSRRGRVTCACVFVAYMRLLRRADVLARRHHDGRAALGMVQLSVGAFKADQASCARMFALAVRVTMESLSARSDMRRNLAIAAALADPCAKPGDQPACALHSICLTLADPPVPQTRKRLDSGEVVRRAEDEVMSDEKRMQREYQAQLAMFEKELSTAARMDSGQLRVAVGDVLLKPTRTTTLWLADIPVPHTLGLVAEGVAEDDPRVQRKPFAYEGLTASEDVLAMLDTLELLHFDPDEGVELDLERTKDERHTHCNGCAVQ